MDELELVRVAYLPWGSYGLLHVGENVLWTVERPWLGNLPMVSCVPEGRYELRPRPFYRGGYPALELLEVPGRTHILFHAANWPHELAGCIAPCSQLGPGSWACPLRGYSSRAAHERLMVWHAAAAGPVGLVVRHSMGSGR